MSPHDIECPTCGAKAGEPCTTPTDTARREVTWFHSYRTDAAEGWS